MVIEVSLLGTLLIAMLILIVGYYLSHVIPFLNRNSIPEPVVGGLIFSLLAALGYTLFDVSFSFDMSMKNLLMVMFFTTVGLAASVKLLIKGGPKVVLFLGVATVMLIVQNLIGVLMAKSADMHPLFGLVMGSVTLSGGHGNGATYADLFSNIYNLQGVLEIAMATATFGLVLGGLIGGPVTERLIRKHNLKPTAGKDHSDNMVTYDVDDKDTVTPRRMMETLFLLVGCMLAGGGLHGLLVEAGLVIPAFLIPLLLAVFVTNLLDFTGRYRVSTACVDLWGTMSLSIFLAMAMMSLRVWELFSLAGPMLLIIGVQAIAVMMFCYFVTFRVMGKTYDAAIIAGGHCGFAMGATPTAVANMEALVSRHGPSPQAFLVVPLVGAFFIDITNALVIQLFMGLSWIF
ncbi:sodium/glutamate symporter [Microbulbifer sp. VAAF005]|uniref:sodium/glutamate symporter n=1 Tax=Microbulbifer sp. VAAF005 TaxID=3034230 RepID=UPI0024ADCA43|nr:sodium/glutamate symporter [Microbulbifer sp. VAAF005]WHI48354.1 sodium/glutamate symporter [Microbulbifer sp. VAAF005]